MTKAFDRRSFLLQTGAGVSAAWFSAQWPSVVAAATHARHAAKSAPPAKFDFFTPDQATEVEAMAARIIPSDGTPGAREAGVVYFIDRALATFASDSQEEYRKGLPEVQAAVQGLYPDVKKFSAASSEQQDKILEALDEQSASGKQLNRSVRFRPGAAAQGFFETLRVHTITAFLVDPESGGNRDAAGWRVIGRDPSHVFQPPFGFYDKDYPGWQPNSPEAGGGEKK